KAKQKKPQANPGRNNNNKGKRQASGKQNPYNKYGKAAASGNINNNAGNRSRRSGPSAAPAA
ncbi:MAG: hypothetical protein ACI909_002293, partial [Planctomycetota bacterium]